MRDVILTLWSYPLSYSWRSCCGYLRCLVTLRAVCRYYQRGQFDQFDTTSITIVGDFLSASAVKTFKQQKLVPDEAEGKTTEDENSNRVIFWVIIKVALARKLTLLIDFVDAIRIELSNLTTLVKSQSPTTRRFVVKEKVTPKKMGALWVDIIAMVGLDSAKHLLNIKISCKIMLKAYEGPHVYKTMSLYHIGLVDWIPNQPTALRQRCKEKGNLQLLFRDALLDYISENDGKGGKGNKLQRMKLVAEQGLGCEISIWDDFVYFFRCWCPTRGNATPY
ncbi:hypothetical protein VNO78_17953 [Psophocarpus tetragonolobus]|uniref:Uncharacterized protein n=1 Tax=Psophocarpus tetragonolobus TaxID=3891 RepID=A0AAN9XLJ8_PSOTE